MWSFNPLEGFELFETRASICTGCHLPRFNPLEGFELFETLRRSFYGAAPRISFNPLEGFELFETGYVPGSAEARAVSIP